MSEIEKLYVNVGITPKRKCAFYENCPYGFSHSCDNCDIELTESNSSYPPLTAEKQIELIKWISRKEGFRADRFSIGFGVYATGYAYDFEIALAKAINCFLEYCSSEEKQRIKEILSD